MNSSSQQGTPATFSGNCGYKLLCSGCISHGEGYSKDSEYLQWGSCWEGILYRVGIQSNFVILHILPAYISCFLFLMLYFFTYCLLFLIFNFVFLHILILKIWNPTIGVFELFFNIHWECYWLVCLKRLSNQ
jgi:hypothetical protein